MCTAHDESAGDVPEENILIVHHVIAAPWTETQHRGANSGLFFSQIYHNNETQHSPSFAFFFRARVPPNFPRKDSSFFILADCVVAEVPDIFQT